MSVRELGTGSAKDVSGVLRVTRGGGGEWDEGDGQGADEGEWRFVVKRDGGVGFV
jgi:elongator complex protein 6